MMKQIFLFAFVIFLFPLGNSFAAEKSEIGDDLFLIMQNSIRNSDGTLVAYVESIRVTDLNRLVLDSFLDSYATADDPIIIINGKNYQVLRLVLYESYTVEQLVAAVVFSVPHDGQNVVAARFVHDGYNAIPGDILESTITFVRIVS